ncbi:hypothetical protein [Streptomyces sp. PA03-2a]|uniref:hypothetical protein n=1 Tax=Streptomyces sp. PA03-2a TaxID=3028701 RepID=UPI0029A844B2|nr:hypothetical protein [Streptomyces sp. PA03-2a]MDX2733569.1 hypothetical protein [Streptomyces sp. PA03-2a]
MGKQIKFVTERDLKTLRKMLKIGDKVYGLVGINTRMSPWEDPELYVERTVTGRDWITGDWEVDRILTLAGMIHEGPVYTQPPAGKRNLATPGPQVAGPLPAGREFDRGLDENELAYLEGRVGAANKRDKKVGRGHSRKSSWS